MYNYTPIIAMICVLIGWWGNQLFNLIWDKTRSKSKHYKE